MDRKPTYKLTCALLAQGKHLDYEDMVREIGTTPSSAHKVIKRLRNEDAVHVVAWRKKPRGPYYPVIADGPGEDAPLVTRRNRPRTRQRTTSNIFALLEAGNKLDVYAAHKMLAGVSIRSIHGSFKRLLAEVPRRVHIHRWLRGDIGQMRPVLAIGGEKKDAARLKPLNNAKRCKRYRKRIKQERPDDLDRMRLRESLRRKIRDGHVPHDPIALILLGAKP